MSHLIQLRQRIKTIETTQKVTHAMRLISMSTHSQLKNKEVSLRAYQKAVSHLFGHLQALTLTSPKTTLDSLKPLENRRLLILVGSQKGFCGTFNSDLFSFFENHLEKESWQSSDLIAVGKNAVDFIATQSQQLNLLKTFPILNTTTHLSIVRAIAEIIDNRPYTSVIIVSNILKGFFVQRPHSTILMPIDYEHIINSTTQHEQADDFIWEESLPSLHTAALKQYIEVQLNFQLFQSLLAEHAARFISMDNATRNAKNLLEKAQLDYNKLRQTKITRELTELAGSMLS
jgi:F-type H+-transporting ATPase subunit gamma